MRLRPFTFVGATTEPDQLPGPLRSRLRMLALERYPVDELKEVLDRAARQRGLTLTAEGAARLASASRETPRRALGLLQVVQHEASASGDAVADLQIVERALEREGVDVAGLCELERRYLRLLADARRPLGLKTLAARLDLSEAALKALHESHLLRVGLVQVTREGRVLTRTGVAHLAATTTAHAGKEVVREHAVRAS